MATILVSNQDDKSRLIQHRRTLGTILVPTVPGEVDYLQLISKHRSQQMTVNSTYAKSWVEPAKMNK